MSDNDIRAWVEGCLNRALTELRAAGMYLGQTKTVTLETQHAVERAIEEIHDAQEAVTRDLRKETPDGDGV